MWKPLFHAEHKYSLDTIDKMWLRSPSKSLLQNLHPCVIMKENPIGRYIWNFSKSLLPRMQTNMANHL